MQPAGGGWTAWMAATKNGWAYKGMRSHRQCMGGSPSSRRAKKCVASIALQQSCLRVKGGAQNRAVGCSLRRTAREDTPCMYVHMLLSLDIRNWLCTNLMLYCNTNDLGSALFSANLWLTCIHQRYTACAVPPVGPYRPTAYMLSSNA